MATETLNDEIRFRCERELKPRLKKVVRKMHGPFAKYQAISRDVLRKWVEEQEKGKAGA